MAIYTKNFYKSQIEGSRNSSKEIVPMVVDLIQPKSVVDVGCGLGAWLSVFKEQGIEDVLGMDGNYVNMEMLHIPHENFIPCDLKNPVKLDRKFDLVMSLEVAEHLPSQYAEAFVDYLTNLGPVVLFSAAIPLQAGKYHVNNQWPEYWAKLFETKGYAAVDCIRSKVWKNKKVEWWYAQNMLLFASKEYIQTNERLLDELIHSKALKIRLVHPKWCGILAMGLISLTGLAFLGHWIFDYLLVFIMKKL